MGEETKGTEILTLEHEDVQSQMVVEDAFSNCPKETFTYTWIGHCARCEFFLGMTRSDPKIEDSALRVVCRHPVARRITNIKVK